MLATLWCPRMIVTLEEVRGLRAAVAARCYWRLHRGGGGAASGNSTFADLVQALYVGV